ncbi:MAG: hypothetical protein R3C01_00470 [Planctomycetaceae bacterium]
MSLVELLPCYRLCRSELKLRRTFRKIVSRNALAVRNFQRAAESDEFDLEQAQTFLNRRTSIRHRLQVPVYLSKVQVSGLRVVPREGSSLLVVTRDLSVHGVGIVHDEPLTEGRYLAEFDVMDASPVRLLLAVRWSRSIDDWSYRSGLEVQGLLREPL